MLGVKEPKLVALRVLLLVLYRVILKEYIFMWEKTR
jgi:hypothetical protein